MAHVSEIEQEEAQTQVEQFLSLSLEKVRKMQEAKEIAKRESKSEAETAEELADNEDIADDAVIEALAN